MAIYSEVSARTLITWASDPDGDPITVRKINGVNIPAWPHTVPLSVGTASITQAGLVTYDDGGTAAGHPASGASAANGSFTYTLWDGANESPAYTCTIQLNGIAGALVFGNKTAAGAGGIAAASFAPDTGNHFELLGGYIAPTAAGDTADLNAGPYAVTVDGSAQIILINNNEASCRTGAEIVTAANALHTVSTVTDWSIGVRDGKFETTTERTISGLNFSGTLTDPNRAAVNTAETTGETDPDSAIDTLMGVYNKASRPTLTGGSLRIYAYNRRMAKCERTFFITSCLGIKLEGLVFSESSIVPTFNGSYWTDGPPKANPCLEINSGTYWPTVWVDDCEIGNATLLDDGTLDETTLSPLPNSEAPYYVTGIDLEKADKLFVTDCDFDGTFNSITDRQTQNFLMIGCHTSGRRQNDVVTHVQSAASHSSLTRKHIQQVDCTSAPWIENSDFSNPHQDFCQVGAAADTVDYFVLLAWNRVVCQQFMIQSSSMPGSIYARGFMWNNFAAVFTKWAGAFVRANVANNDFWAQKKCTEVLYTPFSEIRDGTLTGLRSTTTINSDSVLPTIRDNILEAIVLTNGSKLARADSAIPAPPTAWNSGVDVAATGNGYIRSRQGDNPPSLTNYDAAFDGPFTYETGDAGENGYTYTLDGSSRAAFIASVDAVFNPRAVFAGKGHTA